MGLLVGKAFQMTSPVLLANAMKLALLYNAP
jgi:hypothetical protein